MEAMLGETAALTDMLEALCGVTRAKEGDAEVRTRLAESIEMLVSPTICHSEFAMLSTPCARGIRGHKVPAGTLSCLSSTVLVFSGEHRAREGGAVGPESSRDAAQRVSAHAQDPGCQALAFPAFMNFSKV